MDLYQVGLLSGIIPKMFLNKLITKCTLFYYKTKFETLTLTVTGAFSCLREEKLASLTLDLLAVVERGNIIFRDITSNFDRTLKF